MIHARRLVPLLLALLVPALTACASASTTRAKESSRQAEGLYRLAQIDFNQGKNQDAITHAKKATELDPGNAEIYSFLGIVHLYLSDYAGAEKSLEKAVKINPYFTDARNTLGAVYMKTGRLSEARNEFLQCLKDGTYAFPEKVLYNLGTLELEEKRTPEALETFRRAVAANPSYAKGYYGLGQALLRSGKKDEARSNFEKVIALDPSSPEAGKSREALGGSGTATQG
jgi:type IV pilus assembly protein PilF